MPSISALPVELLCHVAGYLHDTGDLSAFSRSGNGVIHEVVSCLLYQRVKDLGWLPNIMCWACDEGRPAP